MQLQCNRSRLNRLFLIIIISSMIFSSFFGEVSAGPDDKESENGINPSALNSSAQNNILFFRDEQTNVSSNPVIQSSAGSWMMTTSMSKTRVNHTATLLTNGKVLVAGGQGTDGYLASAELYDPTTGLWAATGSMNIARYRHTATLLSDGRVLIVGGYDGSHSGSFDIAELYDPATGQWTTTGTTNEHRDRHTATLLPNGKVLVTGGYYWNGLSYTYLDSAELYDPNTGQWTATETMNESRDNHTATLLPNGNVLVAGGGHEYADISHASAELYNPDTGHWTATGTMNEPRLGHTAVLLSSGKVLVAGGYGAGNHLTSAELYDAITGLWTATGSMNESHTRQLGTLLSNGKVLVATGGNFGTAVAELYDSISGQWTTTGAINIPRYGNTATLLLNDKVLVTGGFGKGIDFGYLASAELYDPNTYAISGQVGGSDVILSYMDIVPKTAMSNSNGNYSISVPIGWSGTVTPAKNNHIFDPSNRTYANVQAHQVNQDYAGSQMRPLIIVHGWQGASFNGLLPAGYHCSEGIGRYPSEADSTLNSADGSEDLADWFLNDDYDVWIAHLETNPLHTDTLEQNAECLRNQIEYVHLLNSQPITIVAHSMGGLVSRAAIRYLDPEVKVKALYTLGSPHAGIPFEVFALVLPPSTISGICATQPAVCQMTPTYMSHFFNKNNPNLDVDDIQYSFIGGKGGSGGLDWLLKHTNQGLNDGLVGQYSAVGWVYPGHVFAPANWPFMSLPNQYFTDETHPAQSDKKKSYYVFPSDPHEAQTGSDAYECMRALMKGSNPDAQFCYPAITQSPTGKSVQVKTNSSTQVSLTEMRVGHLDQGQSVTVPLMIDSSGPVLFYLNWSTGNAPSFTLTRPDLQTIDQNYANAHPELVTYETAEGSPEASPYIAYNFVSGQTGEWQLNITATDAIEYQAFGMIDSTRILTSQTDMDSYQIGNIAVITAALVNDGVGFPGATVAASLTFQDATEDTVSLIDPENDGTYAALYSIPNIPGYLTIDITASGNDNGTTFTRHESLLVSIASDELQLTNVYNDQPRDDNTDGLYEYLDFNAEVNLAAPGKYAVSAELYAGDQFITQSGDFFQLISGTQTATLSFDGRDINKAGLDGPYTIKNLYFTPVELGITAQSVETAWITGAYSYTQFVEDSSPKVSSITRLNPNPTNLDSVDFTVTFSKPVTGVDMTGPTFNDFILTTSAGISGASVLSVDGSDATYTVTVGTGNGNGILRLDVGTDGQITDTTYTPFTTGFINGETYDVIKIATFADVPLNYWANIFIERLYANGITGGCGSNPLVYCPTASVTRAQMAVFLLKGMYGPAYTPPDATGMVFGDVPANHWAAKWIEQLSVEGITGGCGEGNYCPDTPVTRAQMAVFLLRAKHGNTYIPSAATGVFADVPTDYWAAAWIEQLAAEGITGGCGGGNYCPGTIVNRAQMAVFLVSTFKLP